MTVTSFRPNTRNSEILNNLNMSKTDFLNMAVELCDVYLMRKKLREGFSKQDNSDVELCNSDFSDFISIISRNEL